MLTCEFEVLSLGNLELERLLGLSLEEWLLSLIREWRWVILFSDFLLLLLDLLFGLLSDLDCRDALFDDIDFDSVIDSWHLLREKHGLIDDRVLLDRAIQFLIRWCIVPFKNSLYFLRNDGLINTHSRGQLRSLMNVVHEWLLVMFVDRDLFLAHAVDGDLVGRRAWLVLFMLQFLLQKVTVITFWYGMRMRFVEIGMRIGDFIVPKNITLLALSEVWAACLDHFSYSHIIHVAHYIESQ